MQTVASVAATALLISGFESVCRSSSSCRLVVVSSLSTFVLLGIHYECGFEGFDVGNRTGNGYAVLFRRGESNSSISSRCFERTVKSGSSSGSVVAIILQLS